MADRVRPLVVRLTEYRDNLMSIADQLEDVGEATGTPEVVADAVRLYLLIAGDLTQILDGDELRPFTVTGVIPPEPPR